MTFTDLNQNTGTVLRGATMPCGGLFSLPHLDAVVTPGSITALVGGDGAGKTSVLTALANPSTRRERGVSNLDAADVTYQSARSGVWMGLTVQENLEFIARSYRLDPEGLHERISTLLHHAGLAEARNRIGAHLSGGMRQKLGVIMALLPEPKLMLLDEPTSGVDPDSRATLWELIRGAAADGAAVVLSSTYLDEAAHADQVVVLSQGQVLAAGSPREVIAQMPGAITAADASRPLPDAGVSKNPDDHVWRRGETVYTWHPGGATAPAGALSVSELDLELATIALLLNQSQVSGMPLPEVTASYPAGIPLVQVRQVSKHFGAFRALHGVDLELLSGEILGLIGGNGAGKSTLIRLVLGLDQPSNGVVTLFGQAPHRKARAAIGYVPQSLGLYPNLSPKANYQFATGVYGSQGRGGKRYLDESNLAGLSDTQITGTLPLGAQRNLAVTCAMAHQPKLLILDEPTSGMDALSRARLWKTLHRAAEAGIGILITTHYQDEARQCDHRVRLEAGRVIPQN